MAKKKAAAPELVEDSTEASEGPVRTRYQGFTAKDILRSTILGAPYNPRMIKGANRTRLKSGIKKHKIVDTIVWNERTGNIVGGHQRLDILDELEAENGNEDYIITVQAIDVDESQEKAINLALNKRSLQGDFDLNLLHDVFEDLLASDVSIEDAGYTTTDRQIMFPDQFLTGDMAVQHEAEEPLAAEMADIKRASSEYEGQFRENAGLPQKNQSIQSDDRFPSMGDMDDGEDGESPTYHDRQAASPAGLDPIQVAGDQPSQPPPADPNHPNWKHDKGYFQDNRARTQQNNAVVNSACDVMVTFAFQTEAQTLEFLKKAGLYDEQNQTKRYFDVFDVASALGIDVTEVK